MDEGLKEFQAKFGEPAERTIEDHITVHNWPYGKPNKILSVGEKPEIKDNIFSATVKGVSYLGDITDFNEDYIVKSDEYSADIPLGFTTLDIYERKIVVEKGEVVWENKKPLDWSKYSKDELILRGLGFYHTKKEEHYTIFLPEREYHNMFCLSLGNSIFPEYSNVHYDKFDEVLEAAKRYTRKKQNACLVAKLLYSCDYH